ncbi:hypothetical protein ACTXGQ_26245, partial [Marinobacter sp. 1Y8]
MKAILSSSHPIKSPKFATLTLMAATCAMLLSAPVNAAETDAAATAVPSAMDSSKRVIRLARPNAAISPAQTNAAQTSLPATPASNNQSTNAQTTNMQLSGTLQNNTAGSTAQSQAPQMMTPAAAPVMKGTTRVYEPGPMTATGIDLRSGQLPNIPTPQVQLSDMSFVKTVLIPQQKGLGTDKLDVSLLDDFIADVSPNARHYPPNFPNRSQRHYTREKIKVLADWIEPYAKSPDASFDVLLRAAKLNGMGRNLDLGSDYTVRGGQYVDRAIKLQPDSGEANFL